MASVVQRSLAILALGLWAGAAGCGAWRFPWEGSAPELTVVMTEFAYEPDKLQLPRAQKVTLKLQNKGTVEHNFSVPQLNLTSLNVAPGATGSLEIAVPRGPLKVVCSVEGHEAAGMVAEIAVVERRR